MSILLSYYLTANYCNY